MTTSSWFLVLNIAISLKIRLQGFCTVVFVAGATEEQENFIDVWSSRKQFEISTAGNVAAKMVLPIN